MSRLAASAAAALLAGCTALSDREAVRRVEEYNRAVADAYRSGNVSRLPSVAGPAELRKVAALVGVKLDMGVTLDAQLLDLEVSSVERKGDEVVVATRERWYYADRRIGTGERVGEDSTDRYRMRYFLRRMEARWVVDRIEFAEPPAVGRTEAPLEAPASVLHGLVAPPADAADGGRTPGGGRP